MSILLTTEEAARFKKIIDDYEPNNKVLEQFKTSNFAVIAGPAGAGKDTLRNSLTALYPNLYVPILSTTTRPKRSGEINGLHYHFTTTERMLEGYTRREFFQTALVLNQQLSGLHVSEIEKLTPHQYGLSILVVQTEKELRTIKPDIKTIFIIPPDLETLLQRINMARKLDKKEINRRLQAAKIEISVAYDSSHYYCLISDTVKHITAKAHDYMQKEIFSVEEDKRARRVMSEILKSMTN
jgi:guanylate kinase